MKYYRVVAPAAIEFRSDPLGEGQADTEQWARGQFQDVVRLLNKEGILEGEDRSMKKRKLKQRLHQAQTDAYIKGAILRSCHHFAEMVRDYHDTDQRQWEEEYRGGYGDEYSDVAFLAVNARRIEEMTRDY